MNIDPKLDLVLERVIDVPKHLVWKAWTEAEHLQHWFVPAPWSVARCELDLRPGGRLLPRNRAGGTARLYGRVAA